MTYALLACERNESIHRAPVLAQGTLDEVALAIDNHASLDRTVLTVALMDEDNRRFLTSEETQALSEAHRRAA